MSPTPGGKWSPAKKRSWRGPTSIQFLEHDILCIIFSVLDLFDLVRCSAVCKSWNIIIKGSKLLQALYLKQQKDNYVGISNIDSGSEKTLNMYFEELAMKHHRQSLVQASSVDIDQWKGHSLGVDQCRMKMGLLLTGVGDKVMRLWSLETYNCMEEYSIQDASPLIDFDFDESKIVGLVGTRICLWRRNGKMSTFPSREGTFMKGLCMRMHPEPVTCLCLGDDQLILSGSSLGRIMVSGYSSDKWTATLRSTDSTGIKTLCFNPRSHLVFAGTTAGYTSCWDLRMMRQLWETRVSPNVIYSLQHLTNDKSALVAGGIDGVLRILDQDSGVVLSSYTVDHDTSSSSSRYAHGVIERRKGRKLPSDINIDQIPRSDRPSITCLAVGMKKVVTTHNSKYIRVWKFKK
ncbi:F-box/WD-40 repeat-containing protein At3g52030 isoform X2 [Jatropha curcas]|uniref:F-box/WD-40 repeat-containing protein At3g52030 isoform X2 n=1 Tax=Jatropha curcas TaxID=180498 RepID=UPI001894AC7E|nr:F-box/WD-40 repeat-containing protein At3g52030 isoform X2 [Jatropha curcas]